MSEKPQRIQLSRRKGWRMPALSRALVQSAPHQVEACGAYQSTESGAE